MKNTWVLFLLLLSLPRSLYLPPVSPSVLCPDEDEGVSVRVLSYPQYCRYRSLEKRVQELGGWPRLQDPHLKTLEEIRMVQQDTRVLYCRDTFTHPTLDSNASILTQLGESGRHHSHATEGPQQRQIRVTSGPYLQHC